MSIDSWAQCDYPYGFINDTRLNGEQQAIIAIIFLLAIIFVILSYYVIRSMTNPSKPAIKETHKKDESDHSKSENIILSSFNIPPSFLNQERGETQFHASSPCEQTDYPWGSHEEPELHNPNSSEIKNADKKDIYVPVVLSVK